MTEDNEKLIEVVLKVLQLSSENTDTGSSWAAERHVEVLNKSLGSALEQLGRLNRRLTILENEVSRQEFRWEEPKGSDFDIAKDEEKSSFRTQATEAVKEISKRKTAKFNKKRGPYKKRKKGSGTVVLQEGPPTGDNGTNVFGAKTTSKYNKAISVALSSKHFTKAEIIAEVRVKHAKIHRFPGKELVYQVRKAKWRLDARRRRDM